MVDKFPQVLAPFSPEEFFSSVWGKEFLHVEGRPGKFSRLFSWAALNEVLSRNMLDAPRLRLMRDRLYVPPESFLKHTQSRRDFRKFTPHIQPSAVMAEIRRGATLLIDNVEELHQPINELAAGFERTFHERVQVTVYASYRASSAFGVHADDHDVFVLQVAGRKRWTLYGASPAGLYPDPAAVAAKTPVWEGALEEGDVLYMPRGWLHTAVALDEPALHITFGVFNSTGADLMRWFIQHSAAGQILHRDLPRFASKAEQGAYMKELREGLAGAWDESLLEQFFDYSDKMAGPRPYFSLPWAATDDLPQSDETLLRLTTRRPLNMRASADGKTITFSANARQWEVPAAAAPILRALEDSPACSVTELYRATGEGHPPQAVRDLLKQLLTQGLVAVSSGD